MIVEVLHQKRKAMIRVFLLLSFAFGFFSSATAEMVKVPLPDCPLSLNAPILDDARGDCMVDDRSGGGLVSLIRYNSKLVVFAEHGDAGTRYYPLDIGASGVKKQLSHYNYIKNNWSSIVPREPRTAFFGDKIKVILYTVNLQKERGCIGFAKGYGGSADELYSGDTRGYRKTISMLVCPNGDVNVPDSALIEVITSAFLKGFR